MSTTPTSASSPPDTPADSSPAERGARICAIHQPNLLPRLNTLAKLYTADYWIILDNVQFTRRDYQHRTRLADAADPTRQQWLTLPTTVPHGRSTLISQVRLTDTRRSRQRLHHMITSRYRNSPAWPHLQSITTQLIDLLSRTDRLAAITETSTLSLLALLGWTGTVLHATAIPTRTERSARLADLTTATGADIYLCGTGGAAYLNPAPFTTAGLTVRHFRPPTGPVWTLAHRNSSLWPIATNGLDAIRKELDDARRLHRVHDRC